MIIFGKDYGIMTILSWNKLKKMSQIWLKRDTLTATWLCTTRIHHNNTICAYSE